MTSRLRWGRFGRSPGRGRLETFGRIHSQIRIPLFEAAGRITAMTIRTIQTGMKMSIGTDKNRRYGRITDEIVGQVATDAA